MELSTQDLTTFHYAYWTQSQLGTVKIVLYREAPHQGPTPHPFIYHFWQKRYPFNIPFLKKWYLFLIPTNSKSSLDYMQHLIN